MEDCDFHLASVTSLISRITRICRFGVVQASKHDINGAFPEHIGLGELKQDVVAG